MSKTLNYPWNVNCKEQVPDPSHESRAGVKDGKDGDEDDQVDVLCFHDKEIPAVQYSMYRVGPTMLVVEHTWYSEHMHPHDLPNLEHLKMMTIRPQLSNTSCHDSRKKFCFEEHQI